MVNISVISYDGAILRADRESICGCEIIYCAPPKNRRRLKRFLLHNKIERTAVLGTPPDFVTAELNRLNISCCTGEKLMGSIYPALIARAAKTDRGCDCCTVYDAYADRKTLDVVKCAAMHFKQVALKTDDNADEICAAVMESMGLSLQIGDMGGVGILHRGAAPKNVKVDLTADTPTTFSDKNKSIISPAVAEAIAGDNINDKILQELDLKIYSLC